MAPFRPFEVNVPHLAYTILGGFVVLFGMFSLVIKEKGYIGEAPIATLVGIIVGPYVSGIFDPRGWASSEVADEITLEVTRVIIAVSVFAVGVELPKAYMKKHWKTMLFLLGPGMLWGWMISGLLMWALFPKLDFLSCLVIAAAVTPTDPILAQAVIGGKFADKHVPAHVRHMLAAESGCNDGAAFPFLGIALYLTLDKSDGHAVGHWFYYTLAYEIVLGIILGALTGYIARKIMQFSESRKLIDRQSYVAQYISLAVFTIGFCSLLGSDDLLSAFACGTAFAWDGFFNKATEDAVFSNVIDLLFNCTAFIYIGAIIPFDSFNDSALHFEWWRLVVFALLVLLLRRLPIILALYKWIPDIKTFREAAFTGWFGPMGVGAIFIGTLAKTSIPESPVDVDTEQVDLLRESIMPIVSFLVLCSILTHGLSIPFFSLGRRVHSITYTLSRNLSMDTRRADDNEPAWTTHARRIVPGQGQDIVVNRDDDAEEGDLGLRNTEKSSDTAISEKNALRSQVSAGSGSGSGGSSSSRTAAVREGDAEATEDESIEMQDRSRGHQGEGAGDDDDRSTDEDAGERTPPLAEYREGNHLVIERKGREGEEVEVEVVRNAFHPHKKAEKDSFFHPQRLQHGELTTMHKHLHKSIEHATSQVRDGGEEAIDHLGLGLMHSRSRSESHLGSSDDVSTTARTDQANKSNDRDDDVSDDDHSLPGPSGAASSSKPPKIKIGTGKRKEGLRQRLFGKKSSGRSAEEEEAKETRAMEEGRGNADQSLLAPPTSRQSSNSKLVPITRTITQDEDSSAGPAGRSIRFAVDSSPSSDTAPGMSNYGNSNPGFKRNSALALFRSGSIDPETRDD